MIIPHRFDDDWAKLASEAHAGGFTYGIGGYRPTEGYAVAIAGRERSHTAQRNYERTATSISIYARLNYDVLQLPGFYLGAWLDDGRIYLDVVRVFSDRDMALEAGKRNHQLAVFDLTTQEAIFVDPPADL